MTEIEETPVRKKKRSENYVDGKRFFEAIRDYKLLVKTAAAEGKKKPKIPEYIGECIYKIASNLIRSYKFNGKYSFEDQMISDACLQCIEYLDTFDPERSSSAFSFFTQTCYNTFIRRIKIEKKAMYIRTKLIIDMPANGELADSESDDHSMDNIEVAYENMHEFVREYETKNGLNKPRKKRGSKDDSTDQDSPTVTPLARCGLFGRKPKQAVSDEIYIDAEEVEFDNEI